MTATATTERIPVSDRLPEPWETVRVRCAAGVRLARLGSCDLWMEPNSDYLVSGVTHWTLRVPNTEAPGAQRRHERHSAEDTTGRD